MKVSWMLGAAVLLFSVAASAKDKPTDTATPAGEKKMCRSERMTGSRVASNTICKTASEWNELSQHTAKSIDDMQRKGGVSPGGGSGMGTTSGPPL